MANVRYITMGTAAYDADAVETYYTYSPEKMAEEAEAKRLAEQKREEERRKKLRARRISNALTITAAAVGIVLLVLNLLSYAMLLEISEATSAAQNRYAELAERNTILTVNYDQTFNMNEVEEYAVNVLGMTRPTSGQKIKVQAIGDDKIVLHTEQKTENESFILKMASFITGLLSYFGPPK